MSKEPQRIIFADAPAPARHAASPAPGASKVPGAVVFEQARARADGAGPSTPPPPTPSRRESERPPLVDSSTPPPWVTHRALQPSSSSSSSSSLSPVPGPTPAAPGRGAPQPLNFPPVAYKQEAQTVGPTAFSKAGHPLQVAAERAAQELEPGVYGGDQERVTRHIASLLPFRRETVEDWGAHTMANCQRVALAVAALTMRFAALKSATTLDAALKAAAPPTRLLDRMRQRFQWSQTQREAAVRHLRGELDALLDEVRSAAPGAREEGFRLASKLLALRAVAQAAGVPQDSTFELVLSQRLGTMQAALSQARMSPMQLKSVEDTASLQLAQCDRLLNVTFSALAVARANGQGPGRSA